ncbi:MAG: hypothetical protein OEY14_06580, partial [Myxococcales bacterium]|nr:hypothetical protein [Myxococcales bacterium]
GTGLWIRALLRGLVDLPAVDAALRARLEQEVEALGPAAAHARLQAIDPLTAAKVHAHDALRIVRALEVYEQTGRALGELRAQHALGAPRYAFFLAVLDRPRAELEARMQARLDEMLARGWIEEVRALLSRWGPSARGFGSVGYRQIVEHLIGGVPLAQTQRKILRATRIYSRRQRTWFRSEPDVAFRGLPEALLAHPGLQSRERLDALIQGLPKSSGGH